MGWVHKNLEKYYHPLIGFKAVLEEFYKAETAGFNQSWWN